MSQQLLSKDQPTGSFVIRLPVGVRIDKRWSVPEDRLYGHLRPTGTMISRSYATYWECVCRCGKTCVKKAEYIKSGHTKSCGCSRKRKMSEEAKLFRSGPPGIAAMGRLFSGYKHAAELRSYDWKLTKDQFHEITSANCVYCDAVPSNRANPRSNGTRTISGSYIYNGIDRQDNSLGYAVGNCVACCKRCNVAKNNLSVPEFLSFITRIYNHSIAK